MAIYHLHVRIMQRSKGKNVVAASAYRRAAKLINHTTSQTWNYQSKPNVIHSEIIVPSEAPRWTKDIVTLHEIDPSAAAEKLWNLVESTEKRIDSQLAREVEFALPIELNEAQNISLARSFIHDQFVLRGMIADWSIHWDEGNPHVHVLLTMRRLTENGFGQRALEWNNKSLLFEWREQWAAYANYHLRLHQQHVKIDHRSYKDQGIDLIPGVHEGKADREMFERGIQRERLDESNAIRRLNLERIAEDPQILLKKISLQQESFTKDQMLRELGRYLNSKLPSTALKRRSIDNILNIISHHESVFSEREIAKAITPLTDNAEMFLQAFIKIKNSKKLISLGAGEDGRERFTTKRLFRVENGIQKFSDKLRRYYHVKFSDQQVEHRLGRYQLETGNALTNEQLAAVKHMLDPSSVGCIVGRAGTGKSFCLGAAKTVWQSKKLNVYGIALSSIAADGLNQIGIPSTTIESFRYRISCGLLELKPLDVVVMDEAGMTDSVSMLAVLKLVHSSKAKLVLVGDPAQLQPVGPGASFRALVEKLGFVEIQTVYRQSKSWQREATVAFSAGHIGKGLAAYQAHQSIHLVKDQNTAMTDLVRHWSSYYNVSKDLSQLLVITHRNQDVQALNNFIRQERIHRNEINQGYEVLSSKGQISISQGDRLLFLKNDRGLKVSNGQFGSITQVNVTAMGKVKEFTVDLDHGQHITINPREYQNFTLGYAATVHKAQGITVDRTLVYCAEGFWNRHLTYVAMTRHRQSCDLYAAQSVYKDMQSLTRQLSRSGLKDSVLDFPLSFAERRGFDIDSFGKVLQKHLSEKLKHLKDKVCHHTQIWKRSESVQACVYSEKKQASEFDQLKKILIEYVKMEIEQSRLVHLKHKSYTSNPESHVKLTEKVRDHAQKIKAFVTAAIERSEVKTVIEKAKIIKSLQAVNKAGFLGIYERMENGTYQKEDIDWVVTQMRNKVMSWSCSQAQTQNRGQKYS